MNKDTIVAFGRNIQRAWQTPWLTWIAVWSVIIAWGSLGVWGWTQTASDGLSALLVALTIGSIIFSARAFSNAARAPTLPQMFSCGLLGLACLAFNGFSGERGLEANDSRRLAPYEAALVALHTAQADVNEAKVAIAKVPPLRSDIPYRRLEVFQAAREAELAPLRTQLAVAEVKLGSVAFPAKPAAALSGDVRKAITGLAMMIEAIGFWSVCTRRREIKAKFRPVEQPAQEEKPPASKLAERRWFLERQKKQEQLA